jgi:GNAT superfamily N-acetyltransferase
MKQVTDTGAIEKAVDEIIAANPDKVEQAKAKPTLAGWFVGQVMKATGGKANPQAVNDLVKAKLLLAECFETFPEAKAFRLEVDEQNPDARRFYERHGFREIARTANCGKDGSGMPAIVMEKRS